MLRSILVPLDGSGFAERALPLAARIGEAAGATLHLVMAYDPTQGIGPFAELGPPSVLLMEELERREAAYLAHAAARVRKEGRVRVKLHHEDGLAGRVIARAARAARADLVVMSTHGRGGLGRLGIGSVADYVVRNLTLPILLVPGGASLPRGLPGRRALLPLDLSAQSVEVLGPLQELARLRQESRVVLLHVIVPVAAITLPTLPYPMAVNGTITELRWTQARERLARIQAAVRRRGLAASTRLVAGPRAAATILDVLHRGSYDLVAMTTHGYGGLRRLLLGSVAGKVIRNARKPVLVVRPAAPGQRRGSRRGEAGRPAKK
ncbi:MAG TPA: universal stress protein [Gemmatimonadales bacterium]|nr:universal stress protein [Gemmatimonadales bacterium]